MLLILGADAAEGPKTAYVGVLAVVPMLAAVFATPRVTGLVAIITLLAAFAFGHVASDGNVAAQQVRLVIIALAGIAAVGAAYLRRRREATLATALEQAALAKQLRALADTDQLTGLRNRRGLLDHATRADDSVTRTVSIIDCDGLKTINDGFGHIAGDEYLQAIAGRMTGNLPKDDLVARWGGDEFLVIQQLPVEQAGPAIARMHRAVTTAPISANGAVITGAMSIGVAEWAPGTALDEAIAAADVALYEAKACGGNQIVTAAQ